VRAVVNGAWVGETIIWMLCCVLEMCSGLGKSQSVERAKRWPRIDHGHSQDFDISNLESVD